MPNQIQNPNDKKLMRYTYLIVVLLLLTTSLLTTAPSAQAQVGIATSESIFDVEVFAGSSYENSITVINTSEAPLPIHIHLSLWDIDEEEDIEFIQSEEAINAVKWFKFSERDFILDAHNVERVGFSLSPPRDAPPGTYLAMVRVQTVLPGYEVEDGGGLLLPEIGILFFIKIPILDLEGVQRQPYSAEIVSLEPTDIENSKLLEIIAPEAQAGVFDRAVEKLLAKVRNNGIFHFKSSGFVEIRNGGGERVAKFNMPEKYLLPNKTRKVQIEVAEPKPEETGSRVKDWFNSVLYSFDKNARFGSYTAFLTLNIPERDEPVMSAVGFWVFPWKFWGAWFLSSVAFAVLVVKLRKRFVLVLRVLGPSITPTDGFRKEEREVERVPSELKPKKKKITRKYGVLALWRRRVKEVKEGLRRRLKSAKKKAILKVKKAIKKVTFRQERRKGRGNLKKR